MPTERTDQCCNPYAKSGGKKHIGRDLRRISENSSLFLKFHLMQEYAVQKYALYNKPTYTEKLTLLNTERTTHDQDKIINTSTR